MALTATTLAAACTASDTTLKVTSTTGFAAGQPMKVDDEYMWISSVPASGIVVVRSRGAEGSFAEPHDILSNVQTSATFSDFPNVFPGTGALHLPYPEVTALGQTQTLTVPYAGQFIYIITKATAATITLPTPSKALEGTLITFTSQTAAAHVVSGSSLIGDGVSGSPHSTCTMAAYIGCSLTLCVCNGIYNVVSSTGVTVT